MLRPALLDSAAWAVYLGANTTWRLAAEWNMPRERAARLLRECCARGLIIRFAEGRYRHPWSVLKIRRYGGTWGAA